MSVENRTATMKRKRDDEGEPLLGKLAELSSIEYDRATLDSLIDHYIDKNAADEADGKQVNELHCCTREYEEQFLREPVGSERACGRDQMCEGKQLTGIDGFVLREFLYPGESPQQERSLCLLCRRHEISRMYFKYETNVDSFSLSARISDHYNLVNLPGEYDIRDCIVSGERYTGLPLPVVLHIRSAYSAFTKDGVRYLQQSRLRCPGTADDEENLICPSFLARRATLTAKVAPSNKSSPVA